MNKDLFIVLFLQFLNLLGWNRSQDEYFCLIIGCYIKAHTGGENRFDLFPTKRKE